MRTFYVSHRIEISVLAVVAAFLMALSFAAIAHAGVGVGVTPNFPTPVTVGATNLAATLAITNNSDGGDGSPLTLNSIKLIPSCGAISGVSCSTPDTGVFSVNASGTGTGACAANTFSIAETNATTGEVTFTPNTTIALTPGQTCTVNFTVNVIGAPDVDATAAAGLQTLQLGNVTGTDQAQQPGSGFGSDTTTVNKVNPSIQTVPSAGGSVGTILNDTATLSGGFNPTGNVTFKLFAPTDATCSATATPVYTQVDGSAPYATAPGYTSLMAGTYRWTADYAGDANNNATSSGCAAEPVVIGKASPSIATVQTSGGVVGTILNDTATLSGGASPAGNVTFKLFAPTDATCSATPVYTQVDGSAPYATAPGYTSLMAGTYRWTADYAGDANNNATSSGCAAEPVVVTAAKGHIIVDKITDPSGTTTVFSFHASGTGYGDFSLTDIAAPNNQELNAGSYSVAEINLPANWTQGTTTCVSSLQDTETPGNLNLAAGETITCTFHNTYTPPKVAGEYCSPGYWKQPQHFDSWVGYNPNQLFSSIFEAVTIFGSTQGKPSAITNPTLLQVLQGKGGGITSLARAAVGALLNASALNSSLTTADVIAIFNAANPSGDFEAAKAQYTFPENCPLN